MRKRASWPECLAALAVREVRFRTPWEASRALAGNERRGSRKEPYRYFLPGMVEKWQAPFVAEFTRRLEQQTPPSPP
jgi:hypothetical protein